MSVLLYLMRHGAAEDSAPSGRDRDRALTPSGRLAVHRVALALRDQKLPAMGRILASPLVRAQETAEIMRSIVGPRLTIETDEDLVPDGFAYDLAVRVAATGHGTLLVGHQPNIEMVARALAAPVSVQPRAGQVGAEPTASSGARMPAGFRTATIVGFAVSGRPPPYRIAVALDPNDLAT